MDFKIFLKNEQRINKKKILYYCHWIPLYHEFCKKNEFMDNNKDIINIYLQHLEKNHKNGKCYRQKK